MFKVALVGCGFMGGMHGEVYGVLKDVELALTVDKRQEAADKVAGPHGARATLNYEEALNDASIDVIDICLPTHLHADYTVRALESGKHVFCEKPMALTTADAQRMADAATASGRSLMIGHCIRFWQEYAILKDLHESGRLGALKSLNLTRYGAYPSWCSDGWLGDESLSGGAALDMHIHDTDYALYLLGKPDSVRANCVVDQRGPSHIFTTMTFGQTIVQLEGGWNLPATAPFKMSFRAIFEKGAAIMDAGPLTIYEDGKDPVEPEVAKMAASGSGGNISDLGGYFFELKYYYERLASGAPLEIVTPASSMQSLEVCLREIVLGKEAMLQGVSA